jgi:hypothetical protein
VSSAPSTWTQPTSRTMALLTLRQGPEPNFDEADEHAERVSSEVGHCRKRRLFVTDIHGDVCYFALE